MSPTTPAIRVQDLGKRYSIPIAGTAPPDFREALAAGLRAPVDRLRRRRAPVREELWALRDVTFELQPGDTLGVLGHNGAGKSTLLKVLARITPPTTGRVDLYGRVASLLEVGAGFHPDLTGRENVFLNGAILGMRRAEIARLFDEIVAFAELERFLDVPVKHYSSGMYMRLAFSVAAHLRQEILLVDEVLSVGDLRFQRKCLGKMTAVAGEGRTVVFVSHNIEAVRRLCTRGLVVAGGRSSGPEPIEAAIHRYLTADPRGAEAHPVPPPSDPASAPGWMQEVAVEDRDGVRGRPIPVGHGWQARVRFRLARPLDRVTVGLTVLTGAGVAVRAAWSPPRALEPGDHEAVFRDAGVALAPGRYPLVAALAQDERTFHQVVDVAVLDVATLGEGMDVARVADGALVLNPMEVEITSPRDAGTAPAGAAPTAGGRDRHVPGRGRPAGVE